VSRIAYAAAHVVADPHAPNGPGLPARLDWEATLAFRRHLWALGLGVADAMDTAQRGMGLDWAATRELIARSGAEARACGGRIACGAGTDQLPEGPASLGAIAAAYEEQCEVVEAAGARVIVMASRALAAAADGPEDYATVLSRVLAGVSEPAILHWLGPMFDPALAGYWTGSSQAAAGGSADTDAAMDTALGIIEAHASKVDGIKISLLDKDKEIAMRRRLPAGVRMYTGDDFNYAELIAGDGHGAEPTHGRSDALLGIFDAIAPAASAALGELAQGNVERFHAILGPTVPLSRHIFAAPTRFYKTGVVFMAWLNGHQKHFTMVGGQQSTRSLAHFAELFRLADAANLLEQPELAVARMTTLLALHGVE
jgi:hypothetical protein